MGWLFFGRLGFIFDQLIQGVRGIRLVSYYSCLIAAFIRRTSISRCTVEYSLACTVGGEYSLACTVGVEYSLSCTVAVVYYSAACPTAV